MPRYINISKNTLIVGGVKIPPNAIVEMSEDSAKTFAGYLKILNEQELPKIVTFNAEQIRTEEKLNKIESMLESILNSLSNLPAGQTIVTEKVIEKVSEPSTKTSSEVDIPVILDEISEVKSNIKEVSEEKEKNKGDIESKLNKIKRIRKSKKS